MKGHKHAPLPLSRNKSCIFTSKNILCKNTGKQTHFTARSASCSTARKG